MQFLADMGLSMTVVRALRNDGHDVVHVSEQGLQRLADSLIMAKAKQESRIVLTFDLDFSDLLAISGESLPSVILFRLQNAEPQRVIARLQGALATCAAELQTGAIVTIEETRYRLRRLPLRIPERE